MSKKEKVVVLSGPTAVGKSELSIALAKEISGEIISADSMQVYRGMDIGSAKITSAQMQGVPHHLIDILDPKEDFNVHKFKEKAKEAMDEIIQRGNIPILVGGTGFYIQALIYDVDFTKEDTDDSYRKMLLKKASDGKEEELFSMLKEVDSASADAIHPNNVKRVIRALEYYHINNAPISTHNKEQRSKESPYDLYYFVLTMDREKMYERIDRRVDIMIREGLEDEVLRLKNDGVTMDATSAKGLGYRQMYEYLEGEYPLEEAIYRIKRDTRHFAKRQLTWFRRERDVAWINKDEYEDDKAILDMMVRSIKNGSNI